MIGWEAIYKYELWKDGHEYEFNPGYTDEIYYKSLKEMYTSESATVNYYHDLLDSQNWIVRKVNETDIDKCFNEIHNHLCDYRMLKDSIVKEILKKYGVKNNGN